jgi:HNH endonuclease
MATSKRHSIVLVLVERDGANCIYCHKPCCYWSFLSANRQGVAWPDSCLTIEHIIPKSKGGNDNINNLALACYACNYAKGDRLPLILADILLSFKPARIDALIKMINRRSNDEEAIRLVRKISSISALKTFYSNYPTPNIYHTSCIQKARLGLV